MKKQSGKAVLDERLTRPGTAVLRSLRAWIKDGRFPAGEQLPPQEALATQLKVSRTVVRSAIRQLQDEGLIQAGPRRQRLVGPAPVSRPVRGTVLAQTVAVLSDSPDPTPLTGETAVTGWAIFVQKGLVTALRRRGLSVLMLDPLRLDPAHIRQLTQEGLRGVIYCAFGGMVADYAKVLASFQDSGVPCAVYNRDAAFAAFDVVDSDHAQGCAMLARWLVKRGCKRLLRLWPTWFDGDYRPIWLTERDRGFETVMAEAGLDLLPPVLQPMGGVWPDTQKKFEFNANCLLGYLKSHLEGPRAPDALLAASDGLIPAAAFVCRQLGKAPNRDIVLAGFDNYWQECPDRRFESTPPAVTVDKENILAGEALVELLEQRVAGALPPGPLCRLVPPRLVVFDATGHVKIP